MRESIERVIAELEEKQRKQYAIYNANEIDRDFRKGYIDGINIALYLLKELIASDQTTQVRSEENGG